MELSSHVAGGAALQAQRSATWLQVSAQGSQQHAESPGNRMTEGAARVRSNPD